MAAVARDDPVRHASPDARTAGNTRPMKSRVLLVAALLAVAGAVSAQQMPRMVEFYFDADASAMRPVLVLKDSGDTAVDRLMRKVERSPDAVLETAQLAHYAMASGRHDLGRDLYARALARMDQGSGLWRPVKWNLGWDLYRAGDTQAALAQWTELGQRGTAASWMPPTFAIALWKLGRRDEAIRWYAAAVRTEPAQWSTSARHAQLLPQWRDDERATLAEVQAAWAADPPRWP
jgi:tetratricopeptide (TPR) repeat protein